MNKVYITYILNWPIAIAVFQGQWNTITTEQNIQQQLLRIPTSWRQTSWLFTSAAEKLNQGIPETNSSTSDQNVRVLSLWSPDLKASALTTGQHSDCLLDVKRCLKDVLLNFGNEKVTKNRDKFSYP